MRKFALAILAFCLLPLTASAKTQAEKTAAQLDNMAAETPQVIIRRRFVDGGFGQLHLRIARPNITTPTKQTPLLLLHPTPYSSRFFEPFMRIMARDRIVVAIDTPGFGDSDRPDAPQSIAAYAKAMLPGVERVMPERNFDILGYHTGGLLAIEIALQSGRARRLLLPGLPYYTGKAREEAYSRYAKPGEISKDGTHLLTAWKFAAIAGDDGVSDARIQSNFSDAMQSAPYAWWAYHGVFSYRGEERLPKVSAKTLLIAVSGSLLEQTKAAAHIMPKASFRHLKDIKHGLFDVHNDRMAGISQAFLDSE